MLMTSTCVAVVIDVTGGAVTATMAVVVVDVVAVTVAVTVLARFGIDRQLQAELILEAGTMAGLRQ